MLRKDHKIFKGGYAAPLDFKIVATNDPVSLTDDGIITDQRKVTWHTLAQFQNVKWDGFYSVFERKLDPHRNNLYSSYGILVQRTDRPIGCAVGLSRVKMWELQSEPCITFC